MAFLRRKEFLKLYYWLPPSANVTRVRYRWLQLIVRTIKRPVFRAVSRPRGFGKGEVSMCSIANQMKRRELFRVALVIGKRTNREWLNFTAIGDDLKHTFDYKIRGQRASSCRHSTVRNDRLLVPFFERLFPDTNVHRGELIGIPWMKTTSRLLFLLFGTRGTLIISVRVSRVGATTRPRTPTRN